MQLGALSHELAALSGPSKVQQMLQAFRAYRRKGIQTQPIGE